MKTIFAKMKAKANACQFLFQLTQLTSFEGIDDSKQITLLSYYHFRLRWKHFSKKITFEIPE